MSEEIEQAVTTPTDAHSINTKKPARILISIALVLIISLTISLIMLSPFNTPNRNTIAAGYYHTIAIQSDGTVETSGIIDLLGLWRISSPVDLLLYTRYQNWADITSVASGYMHAIGLKSDGTVSDAGNNDDGQCDVDDWTDIVAIAAGGNHSVGLKSDGTVVAVGANDYGQCDVAEFTDIMLPD